MPAPHPGNASPNEASAIGKTMMHPDQIPKVALRLTDAAALGAVAAHAARTQEAKLDVPVLLVEKQAVEGPVRCAGKPIFSRYSDSPSDLPSMASPP